MSAHAFTVFETPIGMCALAWNDRGISGVLLPEPTEADLRSRLVDLFPEATEQPPSGAALHARDEIQALLRGEPNDMSTVPLDMSGLTPFRRQVYETARTIQPGSTLSYGEIADRLGKPSAARAVGQALGRNPFAIVVPCHRVVAANGAIGGFSANGGVTKKLEILGLERTTGSIGATTTPDEGSAEISGLSFDPVESVRQLAESDPALLPLFERVGPFALTLKTAPTTFAALAEAIIYQQLNARAAETIFGRVTRLFSDDPHDFAAEHVISATDEQLRGAGLSRAKLLALRDLSQKVVDGEVPTLAELRTMEDKKIIENLVRVRGIGRWTAEMLLIFRLGRPDVLPLDDYGIQQGFALTFAPGTKPSRADIEERGKRWRPYRTVVSWYLWEAVELAKGS